MRERGRRKKGKKKKPHCRGLLSVLDNKEDHGSEKNINMAHLLSFCCGW